jgi:hypothetical protein
MKKIVLTAVLAVLAACGSSGGGVSVSTSGSQTSSPAATGSTAAPTAAGGSAASNSTGDTISVSSFGDMPPQCIEILSSFLKAIEPTVSKVDWKTATLADFEGLSQQFTAESATFDTQSAAAGCNKYNLTASDSDQLKQIVQLAAAKAPGTVGFITFLGSLTNAASAGGSVPTDCAGTIAAIEPYLGKGTTMKDLTMAEVTQFGKLMTAINTNCTPAESLAFGQRADVAAFIKG